MFCRYCGKKIDDNLQVCPFCGIPAYGPYIPQKPAEDPFGEFSSENNADSTLSKEERTEESGSAETVAQSQPQEAEKRTLVNNPALGNQAGQPAYSMPQPQKQKTVNGFSIAGFVIALASLLIDIIALANTASTYGCLFIVSFIFSIVGTVKSKKIGSGKGLGIAGIVISSIGLTFYAAVIFMAAIIAVIVIISL